MVVLGHLDHRKYQYPPICRLMDAKFLKMEEGTSLNSNYDLKSRTSSNSIGNLRMKDSPIYFMFCNQLQYWHHVLKIANVYICLLMKHLALHSQKVED